MRVSERGGAVAVRGARARVTKIRICSAFQRRGYLGRFQAGVNDGTGFPRSSVSQRKFAEDNAFAFMSSHSYSVVTARG